MLVWFSPVPYSQQSFNLEIGRTYDHQGHLRAPDAYVIPLQKITALYIIQCRQHRSRLQVVKYIPVIQRRQAVIDIGFGQRNELFLLVPCHGDVFTHGKFVVG